MTTRELQDEILRLKKEKDICILAHAYQNHEILEVADYTGDSYGLSQQAAKAPQKNVLMCGVRFMAETVKILSPENSLPFQQRSRMSYGRAAGRGNAVCAERGKSGLYSCGLYQYNLRTENPL